VLYAGYEEKHYILQERLKLVNKEIEDMLGLSRDEFAQTVMIAQGKFREIVDADSKKRGELFQKLFHTEIYEKFTCKLKILRDTCKADFEDIKQQIESSLQAMYFRPTYQPNKQVSISTAEIYLQALQKQNLAFAQEIAELESQKKTCQEEIKNLEKQITQAEDINEKLKRLAQHQAELKTLQMQQQEIQANKIKLDNANHALQIIPIEDAIRKTEERLKIAQKFHENTENKYHSQEMKCQQVEQALQKANQDALELEKLLKEEVALTQVLPKFEEFQQMQSNYQKCIKESEKLGQKLKAEREKYDRLDRQFYLGQAGLLAEQLQSGEPCPVCGSLEHPKPAVKTESMPTKKQLEDAKKLLKQIETYFHEISETCAKLLGGLKTLEEKNPLLLETTSQEITQRLILCRQKIKKLKTAQESAQKVFNNAKNELEKLNGQRQESEKNIASLTQDLQDYQEKFYSALQEHNFINIHAYQNAKSSYSKIQKLEQEIKNYDTKITQLQTTIRDLENETAGKSKIEIEKLQEKQREKENLHEKLDTNCNNLKI
ncbi:MAG: hypothetical protein K2O52_04585, partial [Oscillospiraceae bacterium]|nr:hypothetical protein [Oscillospiraceae bacterium]